MWDTFADGFAEMPVNAGVWELSCRGTHDEGRAIGFGGDMTTTIRGPLDAYVKAAQKAVWTYADR